MTTPTPPTPPPLDLHNVQGDILAGLPKKTQTYVFFQISDDVQGFRRALTHLVPLITTAAQVNGDRNAISLNKQAAAKTGKPPPLLPLAGVNIAFSQKGLTKLGITDDLGDPVFKAGQLADAENLGDRGTKAADGTFTPDWDPAFINGVHGTILVSGDSHATVALKLALVEVIFAVGKPKSTIHEVLRITGDVRPGDQKGHEHFGFLDGISNPAVKDFDTNPNPGQETVRQGIILLGREADPNLTARPAWALDGSLIAFRYLFQLVPEFNQFLKENPIKLPGLTPEQGSEFLGARMVGRWKSGAPIDLAPLKDDPVLGADPKRNNNFRYDFPDDFLTTDRCPFAAHLRKTNPRNDLEQLGISTETRRIIRRGVQFGPEVTPQEAASNKTINGRGLIFVAYQSVLANGFQFIQHSWADNTAFPPNKPFTPGIDPIIGQSSDPTVVRTAAGMDPSNQTSLTTFTQEWVVSKGGEYLFSPSISALRDKIALGVQPN